MVLNYGEIVLLTELIRIDDERLFDLLICLDRDESLLDTLLQQH